MSEELYFLCGLTCKDQEKSVGKISLWEKFSIVVGSDNGHSLTLVEGDEGGYSQGLV